MNPSQHLMGCLELLITSLSLLTAIALGDDFFLAKPKNMAVIAGQMMEMECRTDAKVTAWYFAPLTSNMPPVSLVTLSGESKIQLSDNVSSGFGVNFDRNGSGIIYLNSTTVNDSGFYICEVEKDLHIVKFSAHLIVFESEPICGTNLTGNVSLSLDETFWMRCSIRFRGNWTPAVEWTKHITSNGTEVPVADGIEPVIIENSSVSSTLTVNGHSIYGASVYSLKVFFSQTNSSKKANASNIPEFSHNFSTDSVVFLSTVSPTAIYASSTASGTDGLRVETVYLMIIVIVGLLFLILSLLIVIVCWIFVRRKTAAWMAGIVSSYESVDRRRSRRVSRLSTIENNQRRESNITSADASIEQRCRPASDGYTDAYDLQEGGTLYASDSVHTPVDNSELYATLRKDVDPPRCISIYKS